MDDLQMMVLAKRNSYLERELRKAENEVNRLLDKNVKDNKIANIKLIWISEFPWLSNNVCLRVDWDNHRQHLQECKSTKSDDIIAALERLVMDLRRDRENNLI